MVRKHLVGMSAIVIACFIAACSGFGGTASAPAGQDPAVQSQEAAQISDTAVVSDSTAANLESTGAMSETIEKGVTTETGLGYYETLPGAGPQPQKGEKVAVHYTGMLEDGTVFDSSYDRGAPYEFTLGRGEVIAGWDEGIGLMRVGGKARLIIPAQLGYGEQGTGGVIPPNATLYFDVELVSVAPAPVPLPPAPEKPTEVDASDYMTTATGLKYHDFVVGEGETPQTGQIVEVHYTGWLTDGVKFDSSLDRGQALQFYVGIGQVIAGWDEGLSTMKVGGKRQMLIPPELGYGDRGFPPVIPPGATLVFEVELLSVRDE